MAFLKALGEIGSVAPAASIVDVDHTTLYAWRNALPGFASARETASANESLGVSCPTARHRQIRCEISRLAAGTPPGNDVDLCPTDSARKTISDLHASAAHGASPETPRKANGNKEVNAI
ncbi:MAG: hypothetical protein Q8N31_06080 [Reyranella sp.]|nr:hypothetical protein [Reyranella sp.]MDP3159564.1 hypothetical protein [Reyranella sp.]